LVEIEIYNCGCRVRIYEVEYGESKYDLTERPSLISDYNPCSRHKHARSVPPGEARLIKVRGEHEAFLNE
jgi:hypothetical protein